MSPDEKRIDKIVQDFYKDWLNIPESARELILKILILDENSPKNIKRLENSVLIKLEYINKEAVNTVNDLLYEKYKQLESQEGDDRECAFRRKTYLYRISMPGENGEVYFHKETKNNLQRMFLDLEYANEARADVISEQTKQNRDGSERGIEIRDRYEGTNAHIKKSPSKNKAMEKIRNILPDEKDKMAANDIEDGMNDIAVMKKHGYSQHELIAIKRRIKKISKEVASIPAYKQTMEEIYKGILILYVEDEQRHYERIAEILKKGIPNIEIEPFEKDDEKSYLIIKEADRMPCHIINASNLKDAEKRIFEQDENKSDIDIIMLDWHIPKSKGDDDKPENGQYIFDNYRLNFPMCVLSKELEEDTVGAVRANALRKKIAKPRTMSIEKMDFLRMKTEQVKEFLNDMIALLDLKIETNIGQKQSGGVFWNPQTGEFIIAGDTFMIGGLAHEYLTEFFKECDDNGCVRAEYYYEKYGTKGKNYDNMRQRRTEVNEELRKKGRKLGVKNKIYKIRSI